MINAVQYWGIGSLSAIVLSCRQHFASRAAAAAAARPSILLSQGILGRHASFLSNRWAALFVLFGYAVKWQFVARVAPGRCS